MKKVFCALHLLLILDLTLRDVFAFIMEGCSPSYFPNTLQYLHDCLDPQIASFWRKWVQCWALQTNETLMGFQDHRGFIDKGWKQVYVLYRFLMQTFLCHKLWNSARQNPFSQHLLKGLGLKVEEGRKRGRVSRKVICIIVLLWIATLIALDLIILSSSLISLLKINMLVLILSSNDCYNLNTNLIMCCHPSVYRLCQRHSLL